MPIALFVIILGAVLAVSITMLSGTQQFGAAQDVLSSRAYQAARAGAEWGVHHALRMGPPTCGDITGQTFTVSAIPGFDVTVTCTESSHNEGGQATLMFEITATACNCTSVGPGNPGYVERQLQVVVGTD